MGLRSFSGVFPSPYDPRDFRVKTVLEPVAIPDRISWEEQFQILDQGFCGTCVGKASNGLMSARFGTKLSSLFIYALCKQHDGIPDYEGTYPRTAMQVMKNYGSCLDERLPYSTLKNCLIMPKITDTMKAEGLKRTIKSYARAYTVYEVMQALALGHLVAITIQVDENFMNYKGGILGPATGANYGHHMVVLCGYNGQAFRGVNSWGEGWGENGFFWLSHTAFSAPTVVEAWMVEIVVAPDPEPDPVPDPDPIPDPEPQDPCFLMKWFKTFKEKEVNSMFPKFWNDSAFWKIIATAVFAILTEVLGFAIDPTVFWGLILMVIGWIFKDGIVEAMVKSAIARTEGVAGLRQLMNK